MTIVKNIAQGPRSIYLADGIMLTLEAGQTSEDVKLAKGEQAAADPDWFLFDGDIPAEAEADPNSEIEGFVGQIEDVAMRQRAEVAEADLGLANERIDGLVADLGTEKKRADEAVARAETAEARVKELEAALATLSRPADAGAGSGGGSAAPKADELPTLEDKTKAQLVAIAASERVAIEDSWTKAQIVAAIEIQREDAAQQG